MINSQDALAEVRRTFAARTRPERWLQADLLAVDRIDGEEFVDEIERGVEPRKFFLSAIPYFDFLTAEAAIYLLPDVFSVIAEETSNLVTLLPSFTTDHGKQVFRALSAAERNSIKTLVSVLKAEADHPLPTAMLTEVEAVLDGRKTSIEEEL